MNEYKKCKITKHKDGTFSIEGSGILNANVNVNYNREFKSLEEAHQAIDNAEEQAKAILAICSELAVKINTTYTEFVVLNAAAEENGRKAIQKAITIGEMLIEVKKHTGGHFSVWRAENCKDICEKTSQNYMRLASADPQRVADLKECTSLRQAYMVIGVIKPSKKTAVAANGSANNSPQTTSTATSSATATPAIPTLGTVTSTNSPLFAGAGNGVTISVGTESKTLANQSLEDLVMAIMFQLGGLDSDKSKSVAYETLQPIKEWMETEVAVQDT